MSAKPEGMIIPSSWPKGWVPPIRERPQNTWRIVMGYLLLSLLAIPLLNWLAVPDVPLEQEVLGYLLLCICTYPVVVHFSKRQPGLPVFPMICLVYGASYALPIFFGDPIISILSKPGYVHVLPADTTHAARLCLVGVLSLQFGFVIFRYSVMSLLVPHLRLELDFGRAKSKISLLGFGGILALWLWLSGHFAFSRGLTSMMIVVSHLPMLCTAYLYWVYLRGELKGIWAAILWVILLLEVGIGLSAGNVRNAIDPMITIGAVYWMAQRRINWRYAAFGLAVFLAMQSVKGEFRMLVWTQGEAQSSIIDRLMIWKTLLGTGAHQMLSHERESRSVVKASVSRADLIHLFSYAIHMTPRVVPYQHGETYSYLLYAWVPRMLWANKPTAQAANRFFGVAYDLQSPDSVETTSVGLPHLVEAFINFGDAGVVFIMMLLGMIYAIIDKLFNHPDAGGGGTAVYSTLLMTVVNIETSTAAVLGALPQSILIFYLLLRTMRVKQKLLL